MGLSRTIKMNAKRSLSGSWGAAIAVAVITALPAIVINIIEYAIRKVSGIAQFMDYAGTSSVAFDDMANVAIASTVISLLISVLIFFIMTPLEQGCNRWFYRRTGGEQDAVSSIFFYFENAKSYFRTLGLYFQIALRIFLWMLLPVLPVVAIVACMAASKHYFSGGLPTAAAAVFVILMVIWFILVLILSVVISLRYFLAPYILAEHPDQKVSKCIKDSVRMVKGHKMQLFGFILSFIGWQLLCVFVIPAFYVVPYMNASYAMYARYLIQLGESGEAGSDNTREYVYKPEIDRYIEQQQAQQSQAESEKVDEPKYPGL